MDAGSRQKTRQNSDGRPAYHGSIQLQGEATASGQRNSPVAVTELLGAAIKIGCRCRTTAAGECGSAWRACQRQGAGTARRRRPSSDVHRAEVTSLPACVFRAATSARSAAAGQRNQFEPADDVQHAGAERRAADADHLRRHGRDAVAGGIPRRAMFRMGGAGRRAEPHLFGGEPAGHRHHRVSCAGLSGRQDRRLRAEPVAGRHAGTARPVRPFRLVRHWRPAMPSPAAGIADGLLLDTARHARGAPIHLLYGAHRTNSLSRHARTG